MSCVLQVAAELDEGQIIQQVARLRLQVLAAGFAYRTAEVPCNTQ